MGPNNLSQILKSTYLPEGKKKDRIERRPWELIGWSSLQCWDEWNSEESHDVTPFAGAVTGRCTSKRWAMECWSGASFFNLAQLMPGLEGSLLWGATLYSVRCLIISLAYAQEMSGALPSHTEPTEVVSRLRQMFPGSAILPLDENYWSRRLSFTPENSKLAKLGQACGMCL